MNYNFPRLDPAVDDVVTFSVETGDVVGKTKALTYGVKQLIAREIEVERMRREEPPPLSQAVEKNKTSSDNRLLEKRESRKENDDSSRSGGEGDGGAPPPSAKSTSHLHQKLKAKEVDPVKAERRPVDFFGRAIQVDEGEAKGKDEQSKKHLNEIVSSDVWFKFKEGYNNAVRRTVRMKDLA